jgi:hypothetical protein
MAGDPVERPNARRNKTKLQVKLNTWKPSLMDQPLFLYSCTCQVPGRSRSTRSFRQRLGWLRRTSPSFRAGEGDRHRHRARSDSVAGRGRPTAVTQYANCGHARSRHHHRRNNVIEQMP